MQDKKPRNQTLRLSKVATAIILSGLACAGSQVQAQNQSDNAGTQTLEEIVVTGIRQSLATAIDDKRASDNLKEVINAEDVGKLPDQNLAEVLENITGVQIDRTAGVGTSVQIRGVSQNRVEINGVSTSPSGSSRTGVQFEDIPAALISSVEVIKVPDAKTVEGSVGGTVNLKTLRGLALTEPLASIRASAEFTDLTEETTPRISGTFGNKWGVGEGELGAVLSASYARQDVASFNPRFDRDRVVLSSNTGLGSAQDFNFLRTQFLQQTINNLEFETFNITGSLEFAPNENLKLFSSLTFNDQERAQRLNEVQFSGTGGNEPVSNTINTAFETVNLGTIDTLDGPVNLGEVQAVAAGIIGVGGGPGGQVNPNNGPTGQNAQINPNLRTVTGTNSRLTEGLVLQSGLEWENERIAIKLEGSYTESDSLQPNLRTVLDFINPNGPQPFGGSLDNGVAAAFSATGGILQFGVAPGLATTPSTAQLLDPTNYELRQVTVTDEQIENSEAAIRFDFEYDTSTLSSFFSSFDAGLRVSETESVNINNQDVTGFTAARRFFGARANGANFANVLVPGINNFSDADGRQLSVADYLVIDPDLSFNNPEAVIASLQAALDVAPAPNTGGRVNLSADPSFDIANFFDISETTIAAYVQGNYDTEIGGVPIRGNIGLRWIDTEVDSRGIALIQGVETDISESQSYDFILPRFNLVASPSENFLIRAGIARDIRRPDYDDLSLSTNFPGNATPAVRQGNPNLDPESNWSFDLSGEYYFNETSFLSAGVFHKRRTDIIQGTTEQPFEEVGASGQIERDITAPCEGGGIFNPNADRGVFSSQMGPGICVPLSTLVNNPGTTTQTGLEVAFQYDLSQYEGSIGWLSGFGILQNVTWQEIEPAVPVSGEIGTRTLDGDGNALTQVLGLSSPLVEVQPVVNLSETSFNTTIFYEKYGVSFRARYTWRSDFRTNENLSFNSLRIVDDRGQLNANISYDVNDNFTVNVQGINLLQDDREEFCLNPGGLFCDQGLTDRRIIVGARYKF